ncbi:hypothetical protein P9209_22085 [Prescottella defluvii]|nr:hypothetical protein P9209_22085 [Prescottella defluvii]
MTATGEGVGDVVDDIDAVAPDDAVEERRDDPAEPDLRSGDQPRCVRWAEAPHRQSPQPVVIGRIESEERRRQAGHLVGLGFPPRREPVGTIAHVRAHPGVVQQGDDLPVPGDDERTVGLADHRLLTQPGVQRVRVGTVAVVEDLLEEARVGHRRISSPGRQRRTSRARRALGSCPVTTTVASRTGNCGAGSPATPDGGFTRRGRAA